MAARTTTLFILLHDNKLDKLQKVLTRDNANAVDAAGRSLLHNAVHELNVDAVRLLLRQGAKPDALDGHGDAPLHYAANMDHDLARLHDITQLLLEAGAFLEHAADPRCLGQIVSDRSRSDHAGSIGPMARHAHGAPGP